MKRKTRNNHPRNAENTHNNKGLHQDNRLFPTESENISESFRRLRNALAKKLQDPTIQQIRLYDFRHFKATMEYHKTKDLLDVKALLGHKDLRTTLRYTQLLEGLEDDEYAVKAATNVKEATNLLENGFEYVTEMDGIKLFRKRKQPETTFSLFSIQTASSNCLDSLRSRAQITNKTLMIAEKL